jgi:hypothetical protein
MDDIKYIKRRFPDSHKIFLKQFGDEWIIRQFRENRQKLAIIKNTEVIAPDLRYKPGTYFLFHRCKVFAEDHDGGKWDGTYKIIATFKCPKDYTSSGHHTFELFSDTQFKEIVK